MARQVSSNLKEVIFQKVEQAKRANIDTKKLAIRNKIETLNKAYTPVKGSLENKVQGVCENQGGLFDDPLKWLDDNLDNITNTSGIITAGLIGLAGFVAIFGAAPVLMFTLFGSTVIVSGSTLATVFSAGALISGAIGLSSSTTNIATGVTGNKLTGETLTKDERLDRVVKGTIGAISNVSSLYFANSLYQTNSKVDSLTGVYSNDVNLNNEVGFSSFKKLKDYLGPADLDKHWHHIVEQSQIQKSGFDPKQIHNTNNIIQVDKDVHAKITGYYNSKQPFTNGLTIREWLIDKSFDEQYEFGINILEKFGGR